MKLAYSSNAYRNFSIEETIRRIADLGYTGLELLADTPHAWPAGMLPERKKAIRDCLEQHELAIANVNGFMMNAVNDPRHPYWHPSWIEPDPHYRAVRREHTMRVLALAKELGAASIQTEPGGPLPAGQSWHAAAALFREEFMPCVEMAERLNVLLLIEPEPGLLLERFEQYLEFVDRIDSPWVGLNFDIGHAYCVGEAPEQWITPHGPTHQALSPRRHCSHTQARTFDSRPRSDRFRRRAAGDRRQRLRRLADGRTVSVSRRSRPGRPRGEGILGRDVGRRGETMSDKRRVGRAKRAPPEFLDYFQLLRLPNLFTAMADVAMGFLFVQVGPFGPSSWHMTAADGRTLALLMAASTLLYAAGAVINDLFDVAVDRRERPERPLPSGRVPFGAAHRLGWLLLAGGYFMAWVASGSIEHIRPGVIGTLLAACIVLYDMGLKRTLLGPFGMGACRGLNVLLGMSVLAGSFRLEHYLVAGGIGVYVMGITWLARSENARSDRRQIVAATLVMLAGVALLASLPALGG